MTASRKFGVFAIAFAIVYPIVYIIATEVNLAAFTYHSAIGAVRLLGPTKPTQRPGDVLVRLDDHLGDRGRGHCHNRGLSARQPDAQAAGGLGLGGAAGWRW